jgi:hypothetical protein
MPMMQQARRAEEQMPEDEGVAAPEEATPEAPEGAEMEGSEPEAPEGGEGEELQPNVTPEEQKEYERAAGALMTLLYKNPKATQAVAGQVVEQEKIGSPAKASVLIVKSLHDKIQLNPSVVAQITQDTVDEVLQIAERKGLKYNEDEASQVLATAWEGVLAIFGEGDDAQAAMEETTNGMSPEQVQEAKTKAEQMLAAGKNPLEEAGVQEAAPAPQQGVPQ